MTSGAAAATASGPVGVWSPRWWSRLLALALLWGAAVGLMGPYGTYAHPGGALRRVPYWMGDACCLAVVAGLVLPALLRAGERAGLGPRLTVPAGVLLSAALAAYPVDRLALVAWPERAYDPSPLSRLPAIALSICLQLAAWTLAERAAGRGPARPAEPVLPGPPVLCLQMEDHYVRVHHADGSYLLLATLAEARRRLDLRDGRVVHRSWWVATGAGQVERRGRELRVVLPTGLEVPVARDRVAGLRASGWLSR